jgi:hypothetical protein
VGRMSSHSDTCRGQLRSRSEVRTQHGTSTYLTEEVLERVELGDHHNHLTNVVGDAIRRSTTRTTSHGRERLIQCLVQHLHPLRECIIDLL